MSNRLTLSAATELRALQRLSSLGIPVEGIDYRTVLTAEDCWHCRGTGEINKLMGKCGWCLGSGKKCEHVEIGKGGRP